MVHVDLNLLVALDALLEEQSVQGAAERLHLSAPAMSRTLARIRMATGDDILVRSGRSMLPTPLALALRAETRELVQRGRAVLAPRRDVDIASLERVFTIFGNDALLGVLAIELVPEMAATAPGVRLRFLAETDADSLDLARSRADIEVGADASAAAEIASATMGFDLLTLVMRDGHPLATGELTPERFAAAAHVAVSRRGRLSGAIDEVLTAEGLRRRVTATMPSAAAALTVVARSDAVAVVADRMSARTRADLALVNRPLPFSTPRLPAVMSWHRRDDSDVAHRWFRDRVGSALRAALQTEDVDATP